MSGLPLMLKAKLEGMVDESEKVLTVDDAVTMLAETTGEKIEKEEIIEKTETNVVPVSTEVVKPDTSASDLSQIHAKIEALTEKINALTQENSELKQQLKPEKVEKHEVDLTKVLSNSEMEMYKESLPIIQKVADHLATSKVSALREEVEAIKRTSKDAETKAIKSSEEAFTLAVKSSIKDLETKRAHPNWGTYLNSKIPRSGITVRDALARAHNSRDIETIKEIVDAFDESGSLASLATPKPAAATKQLKEVQKIPASTRVRISEDFRKGRITAERFNQLVAAYELAEKEGRVNFST